MTLKVTHGRPYNGACSIAITSHPSHWLQLRSFRDITTFTVSATLRNPRFLIRHLKQNKRFGYCRENRAKHCATPVVIPFENACKGEWPSKHTRALSHCNCWSTTGRILLRTSGLQLQRVSISHCLRVRDTCILDQAYGWQIIPKDGWPQ